MSTWDPDRYLQFADHRARPFVDLVARIEGSPASIVDLGCGPGQLTDVLHTRWPSARVHGVDSSAEMIDRATSRPADDRATYELADLATWTPSGPVDLMVSSAVFQWVPRQLDVIERLSRHVADGGTFALQVPRNYDGPSHTLLRDLAATEPYAAHTAGIPGDRGTDPVVYLDLFARRGWTVDLWETTYFQVLQGPDPVFDWISGTGARPYLQALPDDLRGAFVDVYRAALRDAYPAAPYGTVLPFRRTFVIARRES